MPIAAAGGQAGAPVLDVINERNFGDGLLHGFEFGFVVHVKFLLDCGYVKGILLHCTSTVRSFYTKNLARDPVYYDLMESE